MRLGRHPWFPVLALCGACVSTNPYYVDPTGESDTSTTTDTGVGASSTTGNDPTATVTGTTDPETMTGIVTDTDSDSDSEGETEDDTGMPEAYCGDGAKNPDEQCDDGNAVDDDGCTNLCTLPACGDGILNQDSELCDDGDLNGDDAWCTLGCHPNVCGDGKLGPEEECDDGNADGGDGCSPMCALEKCGNGVPDVGEICDDGNDDDLDDCTSLCVPPPELIDVLYGGLSAVLGEENGAETDVFCEGVLTGLEGTFDGPFVAQLGSRCSDVTIEPVEMGTFRLVTTGPVLYSDGLVGIPPEAPESFSAKCPPESPFLMSAGGWGKTEGLTEIGLQCVNLLVKPNEGTYKLTPANAQMVKVGQGEGMPLMPATCAKFPGSLATELIAVQGNLTMSGLRFGCEIPIFNEW